MTTTLLLLILLLIPQSTPKDIVTCTVVAPDQSVACPDQNGGMALVSFGVAEEAAIAFSEWKLTAPLQDGRVNGDAPLYITELHAGDKVKAVFTDKKFKPMASCEVRVWRNIKAWQRPGRQGEIPPNMLYTLPDDCQPGYGKSQ